jgi:hypothetical protein
MFWSLYGPSSGYSIVINLIISNNYNYNEWFVIVESHKLSVYIVHAVTCIVKSFMQQPGHGQNMDWYR